MVVSKSLYTLCGALAVGVAVGVGMTTARAQTWATVDDVDAPSSGSREVITDAEGNIFVAGTIKDETTRNHAVVMKSSDGGGTWQTSVDVPAVSYDGPGSPVGSAASFTAIASKQLANGESHLLAAGRIRQVYNSALGGLTGQWLIIRSKDAGATWETVDEYFHPTYSQLSSNTFPGGVAVDSSGTIYVAGSAQEKVVSRKTTTTINHWLIRKGVPGVHGVAWTTVGDFAYPVTKDWELYDHPATGVACVGNAVFVVGGGGGSWVVRKSSDGGGTWQVVDSFRFSTTDNSHAFSIAADSAGTIFVAGMGGQVIQKTARPHWIVRKGIAAGTSWSTVDQYQYANGSARASGIAVDENGVIHVTGTAWAGVSAARHWITRSTGAGAWATTDDFSLSSTQPAEGRSVAVDSFGAVFATGFAFDGAGLNHGWVVRRTPAP